MVMSLHLGLEKREVLRGVLVPKGEACIYVQPNKLYLQPETANLSYVRHINYFSSKLVLTYKPPNFDQF
ncbi:hypothetical protein Hanom_Chr09g00776461 [Helianthus anomalus]